MLQFTYKLKLTERVKAKCSRHPRYNPEKDGRAGIRGGCSTCFSLYDLHQARLALDVSSAGVHPPSCALGEATSTATEEHRECDGETIRYTPLVRQGLPPIFRAALAQNRS